MIHLNLDSELEGVIRQLSAQSGHSLTALCAGLLRLGLKAKGSAIDAAASAAARPLGRPVLDVPVLADQKAPDAKKEINVNETDWDLVHKHLGLKFPKKK